MEISAKDALFHKSGRPTYRYNTDLQREEYWNVFAGEWQDSWCTDAGQVPYTYSNALLEFIRSAPDDSTRVEPTAVLYEDTFAEPVA